MFIHELSLFYFLQPKETNALTNWDRRMKERKKLQENITSKILYAYYRTVITMERQRETEVDRQRDRDREQLRSWRVFAMERERER